MKKFIITITTLSMMSMMGCYYTEQMKPVEIDFHKNQDLNVVMTDTTYILEADHYYYKSDTLFAIVSNTLGDGSGLMSEKQIPIDKIDTVEIDRFNYVLIIVVPVAILSLLFLMSVEWLW